MEHYRAVLAERLDRKLRALASLRDSDLMPEGPASRVSPGETPTATAVVYSQVWDELELDPLVPPVPGMICSVSTPPFMSCSCRT